MINSLENMNCEVRWWLTEMFELVTVLVPPLSSAAMVGVLLLILGISGAYSDYLGALQDFIFNSERCGGKWIKANISGLRDDVRTHVYGQPLLLPIILPALSVHLNPYHTPKKPLVFSFHGWPGTGKNFVADFVAKNMFAMGVNSKFRKAYYGRIHFPHNHEIVKYKEKLQQDLRTQINLCHQSLFVFDEIEKMPDGIFEILKPYLDYNAHIENLDFRRSIFIFLSNVGSPQIARRCITLSKEARRREEYKIKDFEMAVLNASYYEDGGLKKSSLIYHHLIDCVVPFLPLEKVHVEQCIRSAAGRFGEELEKEDILELMDSLVFHPEPERLFSSSGCKNIDSKINVLFTRKRTFYDEL